MDKKTRDFFEKVVEEGGSPVFSGKLPKKDAEFKLAAWLRTFWNFLIGNGHAKKKNAEVTKQPKQQKPAQRKPEEQPKQQESQIKQSEPKEEKLIETLEKAHPEEAGRTELSNNTTPPLEERK